MKEVNVSGNLFAIEDKYDDLGCYFLVRNPKTKQGQGLSIRHLEPDDLRKLADFIENIQTGNS